MPRLLPLLALTAAAQLLASCGSVRAEATDHVEPRRAIAPVTALAEVEVFDRSSGQRLAVHWHEGRRYVAGTPGSRYAVVVRNRSGGRLLAVVAVDGINAISGETAAWQQTGYVLWPGQRYEVRGWRKNTERIAAFEFTALGESYAARTGRPQDVGVIGVALFREAAAPSVSIAPAPPPVPRSHERTGERGDASAAGEASAAHRADGASDQHAKSAAGAPMAPSAPLGTGHGRSESSQVTYTDFVRASGTPEQLIVIHYDSRANLVARGILPADSVAQRPQPRPFPGGGGFVPDPPPR
jgi:hypothetical protein